MLLIASYPYDGRTADISTNTINAIWAVLPIRWSVSITNNTIFVERRKPVLTYCTELRPWDTNDIPKSTDYWFGFELNNFIHPKDYAVIASNNITAGKLSSRLYVDNHMQQIQHGLSRGLPTQFYPKDKKESDIVKQYQDILTQIKPLPDVHLNNQSFKRLGEGVSQWCVFVKTNEEQECEQAWKKVHNLFKYYNDN